jgi:hypothetical protein
LDVIFLLDGTVMKTYEQLMTHYWGVIVPMAQAAGIDPWECVRLHGQSGGTHPEFTHSPGCYTFALTILPDETGRGKPVFVGDVAYGNQLGHEYTATADGWKLVDHYPLLPFLDADLTWTPPTACCTPKKRTFMLNGKELNSPVNKGKGYYLTRVAGNEFYFTNYDDRNALDNILYELLTIARDKEE